MKQEEGSDRADAHLLVMSFELAYGHHDTRKFHCRCEKWEEHDLINTSYRPAVPRQSIATQ